MSDETLRERLRGERDERRRIAELVHDGPLQHVAALTQMLEAAVQAIDAGDAPSARSISARSLEVAGDAAAELRELVAGLEPAALHEQGFAAAVRELCDRVSQRHDVAVELELAAGDALGEGARSGLYQVVREALDQAIRRGPPGTVTIALAARRAGGIELVLRDDGAQERRRTVIDNLAARVADLNGSFAATREAPWTTIRVALPPSASSL